MHSEMQYRWEFAHSLSHSRLFDIHPSLSPSLIVSIVRILTGFSSHRTVSRLATRNVSGGLVLFLSRQPDRSCGAFLPCPPRLTDNRCRLPTSEEGSPFLIEAVGEISILKTRADGKFEKVKERQWPGRCSKECRARKAGLRTCDIGAMWSLRSKRLGMGMR